MGGAGECGDECGVFCRRDIFGGAGTEGQCAGLAEWVAHHAGLCHGCGVELVSYLCHAVGDALGCAADFALSDRVYRAVYAVYYQDGLVENCRAAWAVCGDDARGDGPAAGMAERHAGIRPGAALPHWSWRLSLAACGAGALDLATGRGDVCRVDGAALD